MSPGQLKFSTIRVEHTTSRTYRIVPGMTFFVDVIASHHLAS
jgi:hypothetical protein